jgi:hypothetical protein
MIFNFGQPLPRTGREIIAAPEGEERALRCDK